MNPAGFLRCILLFLIACGMSLSQTPTGKPRWYKGNLHTHTLNSDGDSTPHEVATWYRERGYHFLVLSDHNHLTEVSGLNAVHAAKEKFLLIPGEEVTDAFAKKHIHVNAYDPDHQVEPQHGDSVVSTIQNNVNAIRAANGLPSINHPNFHWSITADDLLKVKNLNLFEVYNGHPTVNNAGGGGFASLDEMWDVLLTAGRRIYGIAVDDAHHFKRFGKELSNPGHGWIQVRAQSLTKDNIIAAIEKGDFYASSGVRLADVKISPSEFYIEIDARTHEKFVTYFIGDGGKILAKSFDTVPVYKPTGTEKYIRARIESSFGHKAWTQPLFLQPETHP